MRGPSVARSRIEILPGWRNINNASFPSSEEAISLKMNGPTPREVTGKYLVVWEKFGTDWKLSADIWNDGK
jgi:ketosteroid isomerase-like protein